MYRLHYTSGSYNTRNVYLLDDLTKRTVRSGGDFSTDSTYFWNTERERERENEKEGISDIRGILCTY